MEVAAAAHSIASDGKQWQQRSTQKKKNFPNEIIKL